MASISTERGSVNAKALFTEGLAKAQAEVVKRLGEEVGKGDSVPACVGEENPLLVRDRGFVRRQSLFPAACCRVRATSGGSVGVKRPKQRDS